MGGTVYVAKPKTLRLSFRIYKASRNSFRGTTNCYRNFFLPERKLPLHTGKYHRVVYFVDQCAYELRTKAADAQMRL